jgi:hypothetical protein
MIKNVVIWVRQIEMGNMVSAGKNTFGTCLLLEEFMICAIEMASVA